MINSLRNGKWLTRDRVRVCCWIMLIAFGATIIGLIFTSNGKLDRFNRPLSMDFSEVYAAGLLVREGRPAAPYDNRAQFAEEREIFGNAAPFLSWSYPPFFLAVAACLAVFPYLAALAIYEISTFSLLLTAMSRVQAGPNWLLPTLAFPAFFINALNGQNGFLTAGLFAWAMIVLGRRPIAAGFLLALLSYKPQFGILIPFALIAGGYWRTIASTCATLTAMFFMTWFAFGALVWQRFAGAAAFMRRMIEQGAAGFFKIQTVFSTVRQLDGNIEAAYLVQALSTVACAAVVATLWARKADWRLKSAALMAGAVLSTPYALDYDLAILGPAILLVVSVIIERGALNWEITGLAFTWFVALVARLFSQATHFSWGALGALVLLALVWRRARLAMNETASVAAPI